MTEPAPPPNADLYAQLMRERYGDPADLSRELTAESPAPPGMDPRLIPPYPTNPTARAPRGAGRYADDHDRILRWVTKSHPEWARELCVLGEGGVAHVIVKRTTHQGVSLCGKRGTAYTASDSIPVCRVCSA